ncbi:MAG TPA: GNAT family N-acetyltransferase [Bacteroidia bacterium]|jgi:N-acetylglutamate synthase-like GNAT family acetyltransferase|nr:GNAT family N-acetyltransferase [Bacteroidia bacterium]
MATILFRQPNDAEFEEVKRHSEEYQLDNENMSKDQFKIILHEGKLAAFGRLKKHNDAMELSTVGVVKEFRGKKLGEAIVRSFADEARQDLYLVTVIPDFFSKMGFKAVKEYPISLQNKCDNCCQKHHPGEVYVVMKKEG